MICPYCNTAMEKGKIQVNDSLYWTPMEENRIAVSTWSKTKNSKKIANWNWLLLQSTVNADYCKKCKKIIINVEDMSEE